jgi:hypothetical protein
MRHAKVTTAQGAAGRDAMFTDMDVDLFIRIITALAAGSLLATPAIRLWKWNSTLSIRGAVLLILAGGALLFMAADRPGFLEAQSLKIQLIELEEKVNGLGSIASRTAETAASDTSALRQRVGSLQTKIDALEGLETNIVLAQTRQADRLETLLSSLYFQQISPQGEAAVYIDPNKLKNLQPPLILQTGPQALLIYSPDRNHGEGGAR